MKKLIVVILASVLIGCGGASDTSSPSSTTAAPATSSSSCTTKTSDFTNGASDEDYSSEWICTFDQGSVSKASVKIFDDGTGNASSWGAFTWTDAGCGSVKTSMPKGDTVISSITMNKKIGAGSFIQNGLGLTDMHASCTLTSAARNKYFRFNPNSGLCFSGSAKSCDAANDPFNDNKIYLFFTKSLHASGYPFEVLNGTNVEIEDTAGTVIQSVPGEGFVGSGYKFTVKKNDYTCAASVTDFTDDIDRAIIGSHIALTCTDKVDTCYLCYYAN